MSDFFSNAEIYYEKVGKYQIKLQHKPAMFCQFCSVQHVNFIIINNALNQMKYVNVTISTRQIYTSVCVFFNCHITENTVFKQN